MNLCQFVEKLLGGTSTHSNKKAALSGRLLGCLLYFGDIFI